MNNNTQENEEPVEVDSVNAVDIANAVRIIDAAAQRGTFKGSEMSTVGSCRDRLEEYIAHLLPQQQTQEEEQEETTEAQK
jgi:hypothetical protein